MKEKKIENLENINAITAWVGAQVSYIFGLEINGKTYKKLCIEIDDYSGTPDINWINFDDELYNYTNFPELEKKLFDCFLNKFKEAKNIKL